MARGPFYFYCGCPDFKMNNYRTYRCRRCCGIQIDINSRKVEKYWDPKIEQRRRWIARLERELSGAVGKEWDEIGKKIQLMRGVLDDAVDGRSEEMKIAYHEWHIYWGKKGRHRDVLEVESEDGEGLLVLEY